jgi:sulfate-transporting ATPase
MADPPEDADFDALMTEMGELQEKIDAVDGWTLDNQLEIAMDALALPAGRQPGRQSVRRREAPRRADPAAAREARHPAARRADQPSRRRERPVAGKASRRLSGNVILVTHDRYFLDNVVNWVLELDRGRYYIYEAIIPAIWRRRPSGSSRKSARSRASRRRSTRSSTGSGARPRRARPSPRRASARSTSWSRRRRTAPPARRRS